MAGRDIRLPAFGSDMKTWLLHCHVFLAQIDGVTDSMKFGALLGALPTHVISAVQEVLLNPPADNKYEALKDALTARFVRHNEEANFEEITSMALGDRRPSELLMEMQRLNNCRQAKLPASVIRSMHLSKLPSDMQALVEALGAGKSDQEYGLMADQIFARQATCQSTSAKPTTINAVLQPATNVSRAELDDVRKEVSELKDMMQQMLNMTKEPQSSVPWQPQVARPRSTRNIDQLSRRTRETVCRYHQQFGNRAQNCTPPCDFAGNDNRGRW